MVDAINQMPGSGMSYFVRFALADRLMKALRTGMTVVFDRGANADSACREAMTDEESSESPSPAEGRRAV